jgi:pimeloyl-ACP methyl ester carboxylesterase
MAIDPASYLRSAMAYMSYAMSPRPFPNRKSSPHRPIILIPGSSGSPHYLANLAHHLNLLDHAGPIYTYCYKPRSMEDGIEQLKRVVKECGAREIDLIGHSQGAMIACKYAYVGVPDVEVNQVISIAGRLRPIGRIKWLYNKLIPYIEAIEEAEKPTLATIAGSHDWIVPQEAVHVAAPARRTTVMGAGHLSVIHHKVTRDTLSNLLRINS